MHKVVSTFLVLAATLLLPSQALAQINVTIGQPTPSQVLTTSSLNVTATVTSTLAIQTVQAKVGSATAILTWSGGTSTTWTGTVDLSGLASGSQTLVVTATDVNSGTGSGQVGFVYNVLPPPPVITVTSPTEWAVAGTTLLVSATCTGSGGCVSLSASYRGVIPSSGKACSVSAGSGVASINQMIDFSACDPSTGTITFNGTDSRGQLTQASADIAVDAASDPNEVARVNGQIIDADCSRILVNSPAEEWVDGWAHVVIYDRNTKQYTGPLAGSWSAGALAALTPSGAVYAGPSPAGGGPTGKIWAWNGSPITTTLEALEALGPVGYTRMMVAGDYAIGVAGNGLGLLNIATGVTTNVTSTYGNNNNSVGPNGDVAFWSQDPVGGGALDLSLWSEGNVTALPGAGTQNVYPVTDGINVVYSADNSSQGNPPYDTVLDAISGGAPVVLDAANPRRPYPGVDYQVNAGWTAYTGAFGGALQVFVRDPGGAITRLTSYGTGGTGTPTLDNLDNAGGVMFLYAGQRFFASPTEPPRPISAVGATKSIAGNWYLLQGAFLMDVPLGLDGGTPQGSVCNTGGRPDAGTGSSDAGPLGTGAAGSSSGSAGGSGSLGSAGSLGSGGDSPASGGGSSGSGNGSPGSGGGGGSSRDGGAGGSPPGGGSSPGGGGGCAASPASATRDHFLGAGASILLLGLARLRRAPRRGKRAA